jgi:hypothetical protein
MAIDIACKPVDSDREAEIPMVLSAGAVCRDALTVALYIVTT